MYFFPPVVFWAQLAAVSSVDLPERVKRLFESWRHCRDSAWTLLPER